MKSLRIALVAALAAVLAFGAFGCTDKNVAAKVNGEKITVQELDVQVNQLKKQYATMFEGADGEGRLLDFKQRLLDNLINQKLIEQAAKEQGIEVTDAEVTKQIEQLKAGFKDNAQFESALKSAGMTVESLNAQVKEQLLTQKLVESLSKDSKVTDAQIKSYYDKNKTQFFQKEAKRTSHILFKPEDKTKAEAALKDIKAGGDFAAIAKKESQDTASAAKGGDLGWPTTSYVPEFEAAVVKLKVGQTSNLVKSPFGWHIIRVTDERKGTQQSMDEVRDSIEQILIQQTKAEEYQKYLADLRKKAKIEILIEELKTGASKEATATK